MKDKNKDYNTPENLDIWMKHLEDKIVKKHKGLGPIRYDKDRGEK